jgi:hypothetical protein
MRLREQRAEDYDGVAAALTRNGLRTPTRDQWDYFWKGPPHRKLLDGIPFGWVLEDTDRIVGTFRNIPFLYEWNGRPIRVVVASAWAVDEAFRRHSLMMATAYFKQTGVDVLLNTTAVAETSGKAFLAFRAAPVPQPSYTTRMLWITGYRGFAANYLRERGLPAVLQYPAALGFWTGDATRRAVRSSGCGNRAAAFDDRFDRFWAGLRRTPDRLQAVRDAASLTWRFALERERPLIVVVERGAGISGYAIAVRRDTGWLHRIELADIQAADDDPETLRTLVSGVLALAREQGIHLVALSGHNDEKRRALTALAPHVKAVPGWPLYYKAADAALVDPLALPAAWDLSLYDGDALWSGMFPDRAAS